MTISRHAIARTRRADITPGMTNKCSQRERHNAVFALDSPIILRTSANTRTLNVIDATKRGICGLSAATRSHHARKPRADNKFGSLNRTPQERRQREAKINSLSLFLTWMAHSPLFPRTQVWPHQQVKVPVLIEDTEFLMEVATGAAASILSYSDYDRHFKYLALKPVQRSFHAYAGTPLDVAGQILVDVEHNGQRATLPLLIVRAESYAPPLLGRSWLTKIRLDWSTLFSPRISQVSVDQDNDVWVERLKEQYREIFKPELGTVKGVKAKLYLKENAKPVFQRARPVPYALRPAVEEELKRMESEGVLKPIEVSDWATPIVCVPKTDGSLRICGDYKGAVNPAIQTEQFPIPTLEEIRGKVSTWNKFTKIDLRSAYQQLILDEESQKLCTINTHKGLFRYTRLPFGISSSPAIWQRFIEQALTGLSGTCVIMDDLLVGGTNDDQHLKNLEAVFKQFLKFGLRVN